MYSNFSHKFEGAAIAGQSLEFLQSVTGGDPAHLLELRFLRGAGEVRQLFYHPDDARLAAVVNESARSNWNSFFGVASRREHGKGGRASLAQLGALFADIDFKTTPREIAEARVRNFLLPASALVESGFGLHLYFFLCEPLEFPGELDRAGSLLRRLSIALQGDLAAAEVARILRIPGSLNHKYRPAREVRLVRFDANLSYDASDFEDLLVPIVDERERRTIEWKEPAPRNPDRCWPGDVLNACGSWTTLLSSHGWRLAHESGTAAYWTRPGKTSGISASTNFDGRDYLWVFSTNAPPFEAGRAYDKFGAFALLEHQGNYARAAGELRRAG